MTKSPSRNAGYSNLLADVVGRDGLVCFLCGQIHTRADTMQIDFRVPLDNDGVPDYGNAIPTCKTCAKRRNQSPIGAYWRKRLIDAQRELAYIRQAVEDKDILAAITTTVLSAAAVPLRDVTGAASAEVEPKTAGKVEKPKRRTRLYNSNTILPEDVGASGWPLDLQRGDIYMDHNDGSVRVFDGEKDFWITEEQAEARNIKPPADIETWRMK